MKVIRINENLFDIRLDFKQTNTENFLSTWVYKDQQLCFLVDCGPTSAIESLLTGLSEIGVERIDYILLTHIHMDHAGGVGDLLSHFPHVSVICHPRGVKHLINPQKLWEGSKKVLGDVAEWYGKINPVPKDRLYFQEELAKGKIKIIETLGHAAHHQSYLFESYLFAGEVAGIHRPVLDDFYIRPATPPVFDYEAWKLSVEKLLSKNLRDYKICYPHYGIRENANKMLKLAKKQLSIWINTIEDLFENRNQPKFYEQVILALQKKDEYFKLYKLMDKQIKTRENYFIFNCISGIVKYIESRRN